MRLSLSFLLASVLLQACSGNSGTQAPTVSDSVITARTGMPTDTLSHPQGADAARVWLIRAIEGHFNTDQYPDSLITTATYLAYKSDATNVDMDGGLTEAEFVQKWQKNYDPRRAGLGTGFLISGQDYGVVQVIRCVLIQQSSEPAYYFEVQIEDRDMKETYNRTIKVVRPDASFLIDDVEE